MRMYGLVSLAAAFLLTALLVGCDRRRTADDVIESVRASTTTRERQPDARFPIGFRYPENWSLDRSDSNQSGPGGEAALVIAGLAGANSEIRISVVEKNADLGALVAERVGLLRQISPRGYMRLQDVTELGNLRGTGQVYRLPIGRLYYRMTYFVSEPNDRVPVSLWLQVLAPESDESGNATAILMVLNSLTGHAGAASK